MKRINILEQFQCTSSEQNTLEYLPTEKQQSYKDKTQL